MSPRLEFAVRAAVLAGDSTLPYFKSRVGYELKEDHSPVTIADQEAEALLRHEIQQQFPDDQILGEEEGGDMHSRDGWLLDPIDGTKSFVCGVPLFATLVAYRIDNIPMIGVAYFPVLKTLVCAERGAGAFENGVPMRVSSRRELKGSVVSFGSPSSMMRANRLDGLLALSELTMATRTWCDAYGHYLVASGRIDAMIDPVLQPWDIAAMSVIVEEAGGTCTTFAGENNPQREAISSNGFLHENLLRVFYA